MEKIQNIIKQIDKQKSKLEKKALKDKANLREIKGVDYFELGGRKFSKDVTVGEAAKVLQDEGCIEVINKMKNPVIEKADQNVLIIDAQNIINSIDTKIKIPKYTNG